MHGRPRQGPCALLWPKVDPAETLSEPGPQPCKLSVMSACPRHPNSKILELMSDPTKTTAAVSERRKHFIHLQDHIPNLDSA